MDPDKTVFAIARGIVAAAGDVRARAADEVTDIVRGLDPAQVGVLAYLLMALRIGETDPNAQEAQLHALAEIAEWHAIPSGVLQLLAYASAETLTGSQQEYVRFLKQLG